MAFLDKLRMLLSVSRPQEIARRYFVTNGFDGALTVLGLLMGFRVAGDVPVEIALGAGFGTSVALGVSGLSSAYFSETAERKAEFEQLRAAMMHELHGSAHADAARYTPVLIALVNGLAPFFIAQGILLPLWLAAAGVSLPVSPLDTGIGIAFGLVFLLGVFIGRLSGTFWLWAGLRAALLAVATMGIILFFGN